MSSFRILNDAPSLRYLLSNPRRSINWWRIGGWVVAPVVLWSIIIYAIGRLLT